MAIQLPDRRTIVVPDSMVVGDTPQAAQMHSILRQLHYVMASGQVLIPAHRTSAVGADDTFTFHYRVRPRPQSIVFVFVLQIVETIGNGGTVTLQATIDGITYGARTFITTWQDFEPNTVVYAVTRSDSKSSDVEVVLDVTASGIQNIDSIAMWAAPRSSLEEDSTDRGTSPDRFRQDQPIYNLALRTALRALAKPDSGYRTLINWSVHSEINGSPVTSGALDVTGPISTTLYPDDFPILARKIGTGDTTGVVKCRLFAWTDGAGTSCVFTPTSTQNGDSADTWTIGTGVTTPTWSPKMALEVDCTDLSDATGLQSGTRDGGNVKLDITGAMTVYVAALSVWEEQDTSQVSYAKGLTYSRSGGIGVWPADYGLTGQLRAYDADVMPLHTLPTGEPAVLAEGTRQNYALTPLDFSDASWAILLGAALGNTVSGPDGQQAASELDLGTSASSALFWRDIPGAIPNNSPMVGSVFVRLRSGSPNDQFRLQIRDEDLNTTSTADLTATSEWQRFSLGDADSGSGGFSWQFAIVNGSAGGVTQLEIARAQLEAAANTTALFATSWMDEGVTRGATNATLPAAERWNADEPWRVRFVPSFSSSQIASGVNAWLFETASGSFGGCHLRNSGGTTQFALGDSATSSAWSTRNCTWAAGSVLQVDFDPVVGSYTLSGFATGDGTVSPGAWTWGSAGDLYVGSSNGAGTDPFYGLIGEVTSF